MRRILRVLPACALALLPLLVACEKKGPPAPPPPPKEDPKPELPKQNRPGGVPQELVDLVDRHWPTIQSEGEAFMAKFDEAGKARKSGDRAALTKAIDAARGHYEKATELWAQIAYWHLDKLDDGDIDQATSDLCERFLRLKSAKVKTWQKKAKGIKELSAVR